ncbi:NADH:flavin oxidoreductase/NADH oxidase [Mycena alexandri]|uniref:NADH:flavin oxidoreductase/NADH oxidase n=1 Tax=Mycena alexandri TaxID=1745969 RepID=A0AAD6SAP6_9AGAR|nr:NADH:flavin oxidoreductase/NADH oxidase [Mycena alexandri]
MSAQLFQSITIGQISLKHRVVLAPLTRLKGDAKHVPLLPLVKNYYTQRGSTPGTLLITESTLIAAKAGGYPNMPGIWSSEQIDAWKEVVSSVHSKGSFIFVQLLALGRSAMPAVLVAEDPTFPFVSASNIPAASDADVRPRPLTTIEIDEYVELYVQAAKNAMEAGFDGVEIHGANGCLVDQFLQDISNDRPDAYGGSIENRARFPLKIVHAVTAAIGEHKTAIRFSPWSPFAGMGMANPVPTFTHIVSELKRLYPELAYIHLIEPRISADSTLDTSEKNAAQSNDFIREIWGDRPLISAGGYTRETAIKLAEGKNNLIAFGRTFIANPDLPLRLKDNIPLHPYDRPTFYLPGQDIATGYTDQPLATQF